VDLGPGCHPGVGGWKHHGGLGGDGAGTRASGGGGGGGSGAGQGVLTDQGAAAHARTGRLLRGRDSGEHAAVLVGPWPVFVFRRVDTWVISRANQEGAGGVEVVGTAGVIGIV
jgi:hypothetical protein